MLNEKGDAKILGCCDTTPQHIKDAFEAVQEGKLVQIIVPLTITDESGKSLDTIILDKHQNVEPKINEITLDESIKSEEGAFLTLVYV